MIDQYFKTGADFKEIVEFFTHVVTKSKMKEIGCIGKPILVIWLIST